MATASWGASRAAPRAVKLTYVSVAMQIPVAAVSPDTGETMLGKAGVVRFDVAPDTSIDTLRELLVAHFAITPRKSVTIRWWGKTLEDGRDFGSYRVSDGAQLEVVLRSRSVTDIDQLARAVPLRRIRVQLLAGRSCVIVENVSPSTTPRRIKQTLVEAKLLEGLTKANVDTAVLYFHAMTPLLMPGMLPAMDDDTPIGRPCAPSTTTSS
ncbi:hypothetical protein T492DRAFT_1067953 [Pavlovales sp. CCMP2436]|nr:hypothetical protein T492DRAFT_1067953 [Pavlovales sp. CCMP2436]